MAPFGTTTKTERVTTPWCLARWKPLRIDLDKMEGRLQREHKVAESLSSVGFGSIFALLTTYGGRASDLQILAGRRPNQPRHQPAACNIWLDCRPT